ncbi:hypothetical protein [Enterobacter cloacae complex sp. 2025EL-00065]|uniref:hypothetical protein n=1 Tax=Enterobacter cloacae complex sp. 2025EL-00065 TaxID=3415634 RepID=UPI003C7900B2
MTELTREELEKIADTDHVQCGDASALARMLLAAMDSEPVAWWTGPEPTPTGEIESIHDHETGSHTIPLYPGYTAPPAPVAYPDTQPAPVVPEAKCDDDGNTTSEFDHGWNACRAAMLQSDGTLTNEGTMQLSGNSEQIEPVSNRDELPLDYLQGHKDGLEWAAQLAEANNPQTGDWLYDDQIDLARAIRKGPDMPTVQGGNSPVTPDGSANILRRWLAFGRAMQSSGSQLPRHLIAETESMLAAAPQQEVTQALAKGMERYGDVMQKLADSGD